VTKTRLPCVTGQEAPAPGSFTFHAIFFSADHSIGSPFFAADPEAPGPRNCRQSDPQAATDGRDQEKKQVVRLRCRMRKSPP